MKTLNWTEINNILSKKLGKQFDNKKVLVLIPDATRSLPLPKLFRILVKKLEGSSRLDFMVALGTHPPMSNKEQNKLVGISEMEKKNEFSDIQILNHEYGSDDYLVKVGSFNKEAILNLTEGFWHPSLPESVTIRINKRIFEYDELIILGPTFPHEVAGFSGGAKYLFPGISGSEMIDFTHWLGALNGLQKTIGKKMTPVRKMIHSAADKINMPITLISIVVEKNDIAGLFVGDYISAWEMAAELSSKVHIKKVQRPFKKVLSKAPEMYDELWTAGKAMYKLESVVEDGGDLIIYAPHLKHISKTHGKYIYEIGYHVPDYFLNQWEKFNKFPLSVIAHCTHVKGAGTFIENIEKPRINVFLSSQISKNDCAKLNLGYIDPETIDESLWKDRKSEGILFVPKAGETLFQLSD